MDIRLRSGIESMGFLAALIERTFFPNIGSIVLPHVLPSASPVRGYILQSIVLHNPAQRRETVRHGSDCNIRGKIVTEYEPPPRELLQ